MQFRTCLQYAPTPLLADHPRVRSDVDTDTPLPCRGTRFLHLSDPGDEPRFQCFFESRHGSRLERIRRRREQRCSLLDNAKKLRLERDTGCAKMMMGSDTLQQSILVS